MTWSILFLLLVAVTIYGTQEICYNCDVFKENQLQITKPMEAMLKANANYDMELEEIISGYSEPVGSNTMYELYFHARTPENTTVFCETTFYYMPQQQNFEVNFMICHDVPQK
ncbi:uncharacterized protein [Rhodnius prolixus]|uniref:Uncharacterized protein n=1 Tax=Rhodnius prolixus TaxID=13249 RepID=T1I251_RHOPR